MTQLWNKAHNTPSPSIGNYCASYFPQKLKVIKRYSQAPFKCQPPRTSTRASSPDTVDWMRWLYSGLTKAFNLIFCATSKHCPCNCFLYLASRFLFYRTIPLSQCQQVLQYISSCPHLQPFLFSLFLLNCNCKKSLTVCQTAIRTYRFYLIYLAFIWDSIS